MADALVVMLASLLAVFSGHAEAVQDHENALKVREAAALYRRARAIDPDPGPGARREHPAVELAREYLDANRARLGLTGSPPRIAGIRSRRDPDSGITTHRVRFERQHIGHVPVEYTEIEVVVSEDRGALKVASARGRWVSGLAVPGDPPISASAARSALGRQEIEGEAELVLVPAPAAHVLAWKFRLPGPPALNWYINAYHGGTVLRAFADRER